MKIHAVELALTGLLLVVGGCAKDHTANQAKKLRLDGKIDSARTVVVDALTAKADRPQVWIEFVRTTAELARNAGDDLDTVMPYIVETGLAAGATYEFKDKRPGRDWLDASQRVSTEAARVLNMFLKIMQSQIRVADHYQQIQEYQGADSRRDEVMDEEAEKLDNYRAGSSDLIADIVVVRFFFDRLPEGSSGMRSVLSQQLDALSQEWQTALEISPENYGVMKTRARDKIEKAYNRALGDLRDLGYFLPATILENGVFE